MSAHHVGFKAQTGLLKNYRFCQSRAAQNLAVGKIKLTARDRLNIAAETEDEPFVRQLRGDESDDFAEARQPRRRVKFQHERRVIPVEHESGPAIALAVDPAQARGLFIKQTRASLNGFHESLAPPRFLDGHRFARVQHAHAQRRVGVKQTEGEKFILAIVNDGEFAQLPGAIRLAHAVGEQPRVA